MTEWRRFLFERSRNDAFLAKTAFCIIGLGLVLGFAASINRDQGKDKASEAILAKVKEGKPAGIADAIAILLENTEIDFPFLLIMLDGLAATGEKGHFEEVDESLEELVQTHERGRILQEYWRGLTSKDGKPPAGLVEMAAGNPPPRFSNYAVAMLWLRLDRSPEAIEALKKEALLPPARESRERLLCLLLAKGELDELDALEKLSAFQDAFNIELRWKRACQRESWAEVARLLPAFQYSDIQPGLVVVALASCVVWFVFALQCVRVGGLWSARAWLCVFAVALGAASTTPTLFADVWQEKAMGLAMTSDSIGATAFYVVGVGLREEFIKLLFFVPFVPMLLRRGSEIEMLIVAACVG